MGGTIWRLKSAVELLWDTRSRSCLAQPSDEDSGEAERGTVVVHTVHSESQTGCHKLTDFKWDLINS